MKHLKYLLAAILLLSVLIVFVSVGDNQSSNDLNITDNVTQALKDAKLQNKLVMLVFSQDNCYYCDLFKDEVLANSDVQKQLNEKYIVVEADINKQAFLASQYHVYGTPSTVILDSNGDELYRIQGYVSVNQFLDDLREI